MSKVKQNEQLEAAMAPVVAFNKLVMENVEAAFNLQVQALQAYAQMGMQNINAGLEVRNPEELKAYAAEVNKVLQV